MAEENTTMQSQMPGRGKAIASLVLGIITVVFSFYGYSAIVSVVVGIVGLIMASMAKKEGYSGNIRMAGFILSLIGLILGAVVFVSCVSCIGCASCS